MTHRRSIPRTQRGFTLVEILVTTAIFAIIMIAALSVYDQSNKVFKTSTEQADMQQSTRIGFDKLVSDLRMAGFDYSRGGTPIGAGQYAQPDEQIEYAGPTAIAFRANFNYTSASAQGNGLEPAYTPKADANGNVAFPYVTTSNDEIVIYALRSADTTKNTNSIKFYADVAMPRAAYPPSGKETEVDVNGIDTTNANPPYTLYRITVSDLLASPQRTGTPVAENIRALHFFYYTDAKGTTLIGDPASTNTPPDPITTGRDAGGTTFSTTYTALVPDPATGAYNTVTYNTGAIGGDGQYDATNSATPNVGDRDLRTTIQSIKVDLTGMNANPDAKYTNPAESIAALKSYRQYQLSSLIVPRNLGLTGFPEPSYTPPGPPTITGMCVSACAVPIICWSPPTTAGQVLQYRIEWDTASGGAFSHFLVINDPTLTSAAIPDDGVMDPSQTWFYRMYASNDNGQSLVPSNLFSVSPRNMTRPMPPSPVSASIATAPAAITPGNVDYTVRMAWTAPSQNDPSKSGTACSGAGCAADGTKIPALETIKYRVARGLTSNFDPTKGEGVIILDIPTKSQPSPPPPAGSPVAWNDSPTTSIFAPGTCLQYYYRVQAQDRCAANPNYNASGLTTDSTSDWTPAVTLAGQLGQAYDAGAGVQAAAPPTISFDPASFCPAIGTCTIILKWAQTTTNTAGQAIGVDKYRISRFKKIITDPDYVLDTTFGTNGYLNQSGASQTNSGTVSLTDSAPAADVNGQPLYYKYIVAANDCRLGLDSAPAYYPPLCSVNPVIVEAGATNAASTGDSPAQAWVFNSGDTITVKPPLSGGITIASVKFTLYTYPGLVLVDTQTPAGTPYFTYTYGDQTDNAIYYLKIVVTSSTGCTETHVKYIQDQQAASCSILNQVAPVPSEGTSGSTVTASAILTIQNKGGETITLNGQTYSATFVDPDGNHSDIKLTSVVFASANSWTDTLTTPASPGTVTRSFPNASPVLTVAAGANLTATVRWQYAKKDSTGKDRSPIALSPLTKLCIGYTIASEPGVVKKCNVVGQAGSSLNPTSCD